MAGVETVFLPDGGCQFNAVVLKKSKAGLEVEATHTGITEIEALQKELNPKIPLSIVINGKGIIHKKVVINDGDNDVKLLERVFPNAKISDFYLQKTELLENTVFVSIVRKNTVDDLLTLFADKGYYFSGISIGPFCLNGIIPLIDLAAKSFSLGNYNLELNENNLIEDFHDNHISLSGDKISIAGEELKQQSSISFAAAFQYFFPQPTESAIEVPAVDFSKTELEQKKLFQIGGWGVLLFFLVVLLVNFLLFDHYGKQFQQLDSAFSGRKGQLSAANELKIKVKEKQDFLEKTGLKGASKTSYFADRIAGGIPASIQLTQLLMHPPEKKSKKDEPAIFLNKIIIVKGNCKKSTELNEWIRGIKKMDWVNEVSVLNYKQENIKDLGEFEIMITIT